MQYAIIPEPVCVVEENGVYTIGTTPHISYDAPFENVVKTFLAATNPFNIQKGSPKKPYSQNRDFPFSLECTFDGDLIKEEEYRLLIRTEGIYARASTPKGMHHALETLRQLLMQCIHNEEIKLPCLTIHDYPKYNWRGFMLDTSRHFYTVPFIKKIISMLSLHHFSVFHWHLTDDQGWRLPVEGYEKLVDVGGWRKDSRVSWCTDDLYGGFYSKEDISSIVEFAAAHFIEVVPEVDLPGHTSALLAAYPGLGCTGGPYKVEDRFGIFNDILCMGNDETFKCIEAIIDSLYVLFPSRYVHIGGDEVLTSSWESCPKCQGKAKTLGLQNVQQLQSYFTLRIASMLAHRGKTAIAWDDVLHEKTELTLPDNLIIMAWQGVSAGETALQRGLPLIMCPMTDGCYLNFKSKNSLEEVGRLGVTTLQQAYSVNFSPAHNNNDKDQLLMGGQGNLWSEDISSSRIAEYLLFPRLSALAEALWTKEEKKDYTLFCQKLPLYFTILDTLDILHGK